MNVANALTWSRLLFVPFLYYAGFTDNRLLFGILFLVGGLTDALDGYFARKHNTASISGSNFDAIADLVFSSSCLFVFKFVPDLLNYINYFIILFALCCFCLFIAWYRKRLIFPHLISNKVFATVRYLSVIIFTFYGFSFLLLSLFLFSASWVIFEYTLMFCFGNPRHNINFGWE